MTNSPIYGPPNRHPLSTMRKELVWEGKCDEYGNRYELDIASLAMPLHRIERIDQPRSEAAATGQLNLYEQKTKRQDDFRNRLIWGDNKLVLASILKEFLGRVKLLSIDPPFDMGVDFTIDILLHDERDSIAKDQSIYALNDHTKVTGVFETVRTAFEFQGARKLFGAVQRVNEFRNPHVAHQGRSSRKRSSRRRNLRHGWKALHVFTASQLFLCDDCAASGGNQPKHDDRYRKTC